MVLAIKLRVAPEHSKRAFIFSCFHLLTCSFLFFAYGYSSWDMLD